MFLSYEYTKYLGHDQETKKNSYLYKIIDSEFEEEVEAAAAASGVGAAVAEVTIASAAVEKAYRQRGFSHPQIAKQIFLCMRYTSQKYGYGMNEIVSWQKETNLELWKKYGQEINKFLLFL